MNIDQKLKVLKKPPNDSRSIIKKEEGDSVLFKGKGKINFLCGKCDSPLAVGINENQIKGVVLHCNKCGSYNDTILGSIIN